MARSKTPLRPLRETLRIRMGRYPAEIAEGAEGDWEVGIADPSDLFSATAVVCRKLFPIILPKGVCIWALTLNTLHGQVENATASSAGDSPDPFILDSAGMFRLYKKLTIGFCCW